MAVSSGFWPQGRRLYQSNRRVPLNSAPAALSMTLRCCHPLPPVFTPLLLWFFLGYADGLPGQDRSGLDCPESPSPGLSAIPV